MTLVKTMYTFSPYYDEETKEKIKRDIAKLFTIPHLKDFIFIMTDDEFIITVDSDSFLKYYLSDYVGYDLLSSIISRMEFCQSISIPSWEITTGYLDVLRPRLKEFTIDK